MLKKYRKCHRSEISIKKTFTLCLNIYAQDFKIAPNITVPQGSNFFNPSVASDPEHGFLVTWQNEYYINNRVIYRIYACRISESGEMLDSSAIYLGVSSWPTY